MTANLVKEKIEILARENNDCEKLEEMANLLVYFPKLRLKIGEGEWAEAVETFNNELAKMVEAAKHLPDLTENVENKTMEEIKGYATYDGLQFTKCLNYAKENYGRCDEKTGEILPFMQHFNWLWGRRSCNIIAEKIQEKNGIGNKTKLQKIKLLLKMAVAESGQSIVVDKKYYSYEATMELLEDINAKECFFDELDRIFDECHSISFNADFENEDGKSNSCFVDIASYENYVVKETGEDFFETALEKICDSGVLEENNNLANDIRAYLTISYSSCCNNCNAIVKIMMENVLVIPLLEYVENGNYQLKRRKNVWQADIYQQFLKEVEHKEYKFRTISKRFDEVKRILEV